VKELTKKLKELQDKFEKDGNKGDAKTISETLIMLDNLSYDVEMYKQWDEEGRGIVENKKSK
jgi:hypothetical protein